MRRCPGGGRGARGRPTRPVSSPGRRRFRRPPVSQHQLSTDPRPRADVTSAGASPSPLTQRVSLASVPAQPLQTRRRLLLPQVTCHEICHLIGLGNCRWLQCIMQGALSLDEALLRPLEPCPVCLRKLQYVAGFKLIERYRKLYAWIQTVLSTWPSQESDLSTSEDLLPFSSDSGMCCENDSEPLTSLSEPLTPDTCSQAVSIGQELEHDQLCVSPADTHSQLQLGRTTKSTDIIKDYELWLETCIAALEKKVSEEELAQVDKTVDALAKWEMFTGQLPTMRKDLPFPRDNAGLRKVLGDKFSSLRRKLNYRKLSKAESSPHCWSWEEN
uniref:Uncharacterized protein n=1 Tax=Gopherus agassizii TaxID=38772 RepID=A0A452IRQ1_9SAUR